MSGHEHLSPADAVLNEAMDAYVAMDADGRIVAWNRRAEEMFGWPASMALGRDLAGLIIPPAQRAAHRAGRERFRSAGSARMLNRRLQLTAMHRDGTEIPVDMTISALVTEAGLRFNAFIADGTQTRRAQRHRDVQNAVLQVLASATTHAEALGGVLTAIGDGLGWDVAAYWSQAHGGLRCERIWHSDNHGIETFAATTAALVVEPGTDLPGRAWEQRSPAWVHSVQRDPAPRRAAAARARLQSGIAMPVLVKGVPVGVVELYGEKTRRPDDELVALLETLCAQTAHYVERKRLQDENDRVGREFFALVSHELRTPLTSILGYLELLREDPGIGEHARQALDVIDRNASRLEHLVGDLLYVAQVQAGSFGLRPAETRPDEVVAEALEAARPKADEGAVRLTGSHPDVGVLFADRVRLGQLVDNLVSNALKFTPPGGEVRVSLDRDGGDAVLRVADTGIGVSDADRLRLFERFFRTSQATDGAVAGVGLGLTISKAIVEGHGGQIELASAEGEGTTVTVRLPGLAGVRAPAPDAAAHG